VVTVSCIISIEPFLTIQCTNTSDVTKVYPNPDYVDDSCRRTRFLRLLFLTREECSWARRLLASAVMGGVIGWERRQADRPAGIRTMALVSLASCLFTVGSAFAFRSGPQDWDASRISAAIPSGVGFLGAGLIFKGIPSLGGDGMPVVHGLTTAASLWISSAVGIACGGELYFPASFTVAILLMLLRFGPRIDRHDDDTDDDDDEDGEHANEGGVAKGDLPYGEYGAATLSDGAATLSERLKDAESQSLVSRHSQKLSTRKTSNYLGL
jgi:putative Mg2+ transporter-C (MgtC) family protein